MAETTGYLLNFLETKTSTVLVCIDWANVFNWQRVFRKDRVNKIQQKIDAKKLYNYLKNIKQVKEIKLFYGLDKAREDVLDNMVRWVELRTGKKPANIDELYTEAQKIHKKEKLSDAMWSQVKEVFDEYYSHSRLEELKKIGYDLSSQKDVKSFSNTLYSLAKFKSVLEKLDKIIDDLLEKESKCSTSTEKDLITQIKELKKCLKQKIKDRKCDFDVDIVIDMVRNMDKYDTFIIFSGDGDFAPAIKYFREKNKNVIVVSKSNKLGREITNLEDKFKPVIIFSEKINEFWK